MRIITKTISIIMTLSLLFQNHSMANVFPKITEQNLKKSEYNLTSNKIKENIKIVHLSDYHNETYELKDEQILEEVKLQKPNLIVLTGDMLDAETLNLNFKIEDDIINNPSINFLNQLGEISPTYYIMGNNEDFKKEEWLLIEQELVNINFIYDDFKTIEINNEKINLIGLTDLHLLPKTKENEHTIIENKLKNILKNINNNYYNLVLVHRPDYLPEISKYPIDLVLAGHTHGGQVLINKKPVILPNKNCLYVQGLYKEKDTILIVNQGLGTSGIKLRKDCPSEIGIITIERKNK